ncbi:MAG: hypothetical protein UR80_C0021G0005 [Parcubacteria group bacterium GW2011_GWB1_35_5]|uniref:Uncharacterized protein n=1 Tax=Candidatus Zambryskibacteria bacterium RIFCSPLOWO2_01_FULL_35_19 TaxID=1802757 RepID=A0A1G2TVF2_9BACT|nr:MAG: hypothetical protein UR80_C0021G0005 [Parcubacteria group bacterium GW2011_GWB1_35_5]OHA86552.1 MAG: hypothetical protein A2726_01990 [Candidatus Zambryskibacteria bacterium RIFCSPHIGHO2_01_FULL_35_32]OHB01298.1 MAG: hypothetical protein A3A90_01415 [Candidatus Zambryskibacteria bacterium RIFCSPLOWO2_01_FULL_35_19]
MNYFDIYLTVASVATIAVAGLLALILMYVLAILYDIKRLSKIAKKETEIIARGIERGASIFGSELSNEATGFAKTVFALLLSHFAGKTKTKSKPRKNKTKITND